MSCSINLTSRLIPSGVVRENGAPKATVSTYLFRLVHCHQPLHTSGGSSCFLRDLSPVFLILCFVVESQPKSPLITLTPPIFYPECEIINNSLLSVGIEPTTAAFTIKWCAAVPRWPLVIMKIILKYFSTYIK